MISMKRLSLLSVVAIFLSVFSAPAHSQQISPAPPGTLRLMVFDTWRLHDGSTIRLFTETNGQRKFHGNCQTLAPGYKSSGPLNSSCDPSDYRVKVIPSVDLVAPVCTDVKSFCLESVKAEVKGATTKAKLIGYASDSRVDAVPKFGIPSGRSSSIWQIPGVLHSGGSDYYQVKLDLIANVGLWFYLINGRLGENRPLEITNFDLRIRPANLARPDDATSAILCDECDMPTSARLQVNALLNHDILGMKWFYSRIKNADVSITKTRGNQYRYAISGNPMPLQTVDARKPFSESPRALVELHKKLNNGCTETSKTNSCWGIVVNGNRPWEAEELLNAWKPVVSDSATKTTSQWFIRSNYQDSGQWFNDMAFYRCAPKDKPAGIVTSNALMTTGSIPEYKAGSLNYKVSSLHFEEDKVTPYKGFYEFVMDEKLARCLFKFPAAPISAKITVTGAGGDVEIESVTANNSNGKMRFVASNFGYSSKTIAISFAPKGYKVCVRGASSIFAKGTTCPKGFKIK